MSSFTFGVDGMPDDEKPPERESPRPNGSGIKMTPFGKEINGVPVLEINRIHREARERLNELDQQNWKHLAARCWKISTVEKPGQRAMIAEALLMGLHDGDPPDLEEYAEATGNSVIDAADELSSVGGFEEKPYGIVTGEVHFDNDDIPEPTEDEDDDGFGDLEIGSVEA